MCSVQFGRSSVLGIAPRIRTGRSGVRISLGAIRADRLSSYSYGGISVPGVERPGRDVNHSRPVKFKNQWSCTSTPPLPLWHGQGKTGFSLYVLEYLML